MKFNDFWESKKKLYALGFKNKGDVEAGWNACLEYRFAPSTSTKEEVQCLCNSCMQGDCDGLYNKGNYCPKFIVSECNGYYNQ